MPWRRTCAFKDAFYSSEPAVRSPYREAADVHYLHGEQSAPVLDNRHAKPLDALDATQLAQHRPPEKAVS